MEILQNLLNKENVFFIIGILIAIYYGNKVFKKKILYRIAKNKHSTIIAFWNAAPFAIKREDIYYMQVKCTKSTTCKEVYASDNSMHLEIVPQRGSKSTNIGYKLDFNFLTKRQGYIIQIDDPTALFNGRINGENEKSVELYSPVSLGALLSKDLFVIILIIAFVIPVFLIQEPNENGLWAAGFSAVVAFCGIFTMIIGIVLMIYDSWNKYYTIKTSREFSEKLKNENENYSEEKKTLEGLFFWRDFISDLLRTYECLKKIFFKK